ncbi:50S ribosomal protein L22 [bacterium]|nr:MAG: 50S ribosomal protein L22 [bacterium]
MISKAQWKYVRISPKKLRLVADEIRGMEVDKALSLLPMIPKKGARILRKALKSAVANALTREDVSVRQDELYISKLMINDAPRMKRWRPISRGRAVPYQHRFSHIVIELDTYENEE